MRVATANSYDSTVNTLNKRQAELSAQQDRIATGKRVQRASDDPVAAVMAEAAQNRLSRALVDQRAVEASRTSLNQAESALGNAGELVQDVRELLLKAGNATYGSKEFQSIAQEIEGLRERMLGVANQKDSAGRTLFGGLGGTATPFVEAYGPGGGGVRFDGQRGQEAAGNNSLPQTFDGEVVFMRVPAGNGTFTIDLPAGNTGGLHTDVGQVSDPSALTGHAYSVSFADVGGTLEYTVTDTTSGTPVAGHSGVPYVAGSALEFEGMSMTLLGTPAPGDTLDVNPVTGPTDIFKVMQDAVDALRSVTSGGQTAQLTQALGRTLTELDAGHDRVLSARSQAGEWLNRADAIDGLLSDRQVDYKAEKSRLEDLDMIQGISDFQSQQTGLQAALQSYASVQKLSLFQYVS
jgi:flagellar hook-associated protein 3 FlgL